MIQLLCQADFFETICAHISAQQTLVKRAFDTRRINQNTEFNPRRNLQYFQRSEPYLNPHAADQIALFFKVKTAADQIRQQFIGEPDWLDSHTRILCNALDQTLRIEQRDMDYSPAQLEYLNELLYVRYRLRPEDIKQATEKQLQDTLMNKDERLLRRSIFINYQEGMNKHSVTHQAPVQDTLMDKLFTAKATAENKEIERSVTITIKDKIVDDITKNASMSKQRAKPI